MTALADALPTDLLDMAVALALQNAREGHGPFGAVVETRGALFFPAREDLATDPTGHAAVRALRAAAATLKRNDLSDSTLYLSCAPCHLCSAAAWWARVKEVRYATTVQDVLDAGHPVLELAEAARVPGDSGILLPLMAARRDSALEPFREWGARRV